MKGCAKSPALAVRRHTRHRVCLRNLPKTAMKTDVWCLPAEILLNVLRRLHIKDLLNLCSTCSHFHDLINEHSSVWTAVSFSEVWPTEKTIQHFDKAMKHGNLEAAIKLGIAYLYNEGLPGDFEGKRISSNGQRAASMFCEVESLATRTPPFTWLFIRPPWTMAGACCKEYVFKNMKSYVALHEDKSCTSACVCIARTLELLDCDTKHAEMMKYLNKAVEQGSAVAAYSLWKQKYDDKVLDRAQELESLRELRHISSPDCLEAQLKLCKFYVCGRYGGHSMTQAAAFVRGFVHSSKPTNLVEIFRTKELTHSMRYILVDWLIEVASMKDFSTRTLHIAISMLDRFLRFQPTPRSRLQLLGVSAMVLSSRLLGKEILTIREAAWLTDNTYKYEDVVRMMGEITAVLRGHFRIPISLDYVDILGQAAENDPTTQLLAEYLCEHSLLQSSLGASKQSLVAASCVYLARLVRAKETPWPGKMETFSGFSKSHLLPCLFEIHTKCFHAGPMSDHRNVVLQAVKQRYSDDQYGAVSDLQMLSHEDLCHSLDVSTDITSADLAAVKPSMSTQTQNLIMSPSRRRHCSGQSGSVPPPRFPSQDRQQAATPTVEPPANVQALNESTVSGYEGDKEDEGESLMETEVYDSDPDLESLWCADHLNSSTDHQSYEDPDTSGMDDNSSSMFSFSHSLASFSVSARTQPTSLSVPQALGFHMQQVAGTENINLTPTPSSQSVASMVFSADQPDPHTSQSAVSMTFAAGLPLPENSQSAAPVSAGQSKDSQSAPSSAKSKPDSLNQSKSMSVYVDEKKPGNKVQLQQRNESLRSPRLALRAVNGNKVVDSSVATKSSKRKTPPQHLGSQNKQHIGS